jgi:hypothetical protein
LLCNKAPSIPFCYYLYPYIQKRELGAPSKKDEEREKNNNKIKERGQMSQHKRDF